ncbi:hypothetical protein O1K_07117 [Xanthomonas fragariae LMG 25863]|nr:hypothetical protein O1K_07117 [Xanthomonas fragariae LMG 25863]
MWTAPAALERLGDDLAAGAGEIRDQGLATALWLARSRPVANAPAGTLKRARPTQLSPTRWWRSSANPLPKMATIKPVSGPAPVAAHVWTCLSGIAVAMMCSPCAGQAGRTYLVADRQAGRGKAWAKIATAGAKSAQTADSFNSK